MGKRRARRVGRHAIPFLEHDGEYWGPPPDDEAAIAELERLRTEKGVAFIVFPWTASWWLRTIPIFTIVSVLDMPAFWKMSALIVFDIRQTQHVPRARVAPMLSICTTVKNRSRVHVEGRELLLFPNCVETIVRARGGVADGLELVVTDWESDDWPLAEWLEDARIQFQCAC